MIELRANNLCAKVEQRVILKNVSAVLPCAAITAIVGPSGSGKTTLLRHLAFLDEPSSGEIVCTLDDLTFTSEREGKPWPFVTCVFQRQFLWPHLTIRQNILAPLLSLGRSEEDAEFAIELFGMREYLDRFPNQVSGGEAQRAALARAFVLKPRFLLLDEAHTFLDLKQQLTLNKYLVELRALGIGLGVVTHSLGFVRRYADHLLVIENGAALDIAKSDGHFNIPRTTDFLCSLADANT